MKNQFALGFAAMALASSVYAADQSIPGGGNADALRIASGSKVAVAAQRFNVEVAHSIRNLSVRNQTIDALDPKTCIRHRAGVGTMEKQAVLASLVAAGFVSASDATGWGPGALNGVFPPVVDEGSACPHLPQPFLASPGGGFHGHHSYPGGLVIHVAMNTRIAQSLDSNYAKNYSLDGDRDDNDSVLDHDLVVAGPLWHDWAKPLVFQWNADGSEFAQLTIAGTGSHHILGLAEAIARGLPADFVATQASAHNTPTEGNEGLVAGWISAASIIARVDAVAKGYLVRDGSGKLQLPPVHHLGDVDLVAAGQMNMMAEYVVDSLSDSDWTYTEPALSIAEVLIAKLAPRFGYDPTAVHYNVSYRNVVLSNLTAERIEMTYQREGFEAVARMFESLRRHGRI
jgi:hypothetical protein